MKRSVGSHLYRVVTMLFVLGVISDGAWGRQAEEGEEGPVIVGERRGRYRPFELARLDGSLDFFIRRRRDERKQRGEATTVDTETQVRSNLEIDSEFYIGHKNLLDVSANLQFGVERTTLESDTQFESTQDSTFFNQYDIRGLLLGEGPAPTTLYSRRDQTLLDRQFAGSIRSIATETGFITTIRSQSAPTTIQFFHREEDQTDQSGTADFNVVQNTFSIQSTLRLTDQQQIDIDYTFNRVDENQGAEFGDAFDRHDGTITHNLGFGSENRNTLRSSLRYYSQSGNLDQKFVRLDERLVLHHTDNFQTQYDLTFLRQENSGNTQNLVRGNASLIHQLFESLTTTASVGGSHIEIPGDFSSDELFVNLVLDYVKRVPFGRVEASLGGAFNRQNNSDRGSTISTINEPHTFRDPFPVTISRRNILANSVVVTEVGGLRVFQRGDDYTLDAFQDRVELRRVVGGAIGEGEGVLVSFDIGPEPGSEISTTGVSASLRYSITEGWLDGVSVYGSFRQIDNSIQTANPTQFVLDDFQDLIYGAEYRFRGYTFSAERQNHDSTVSPFDATRFEARLDQRLSRDSALRISLTRESIDYTDEERSVDLNRIVARWTHRLDRSLDFNVRLEYRDEQDSVSGDVKGFEQGLELNWSKRQTSAYIQFRNATLDAESEETSSQTIAFGFRRSF